MSAPPFVAHVSRWRTGLIVALALGFVALGAALAGQPDTAPRLAGWAAILLFGVGAVIGGRELLRAGPVLRVDDAGILWRRWSDAVIPWSAVASAGVRTTQQQRFLCLTLRDPQAHRSTRVLGKLAGANRALGFGDVAVNVAGTDRRFDALVAAVAARMSVAP